MKWQTNKALIMNHACIAWCGGGSETEGAAENMAKLGTEKRPIVVGVQTEARAQYVAQECAKHGWHYIIGLEEDEPEMMADLERALNRSLPVHAQKIGRNDPCPCGSGRKYKKCCGAGAA